MKNKFFAGALAGTMALSAILLGACGSTDSGTTQAATETASGDEVELFSTKPENAETLQKLVDSFNEQNRDSGETIVLNTPADAGTVLKTRLAKNDLPDIMAMGGDSNYTEVESTGMLEDLSGESYISGIQEEYMEMVYDVQEDKEQVAYAVPYATNASGVLYNVDKFNELGLEIPKTWDEFMDVIAAIEQSGGTPFEFTFKDNWTALCPWNSIAPDLQPETFMDDRLAGNTTFADTHQEIAEKYLELIKHGQADIMGTSYDDGNKAFANGDAYMMINGNWAISQFVASNPDMNVDMFALPASNDESKNYVTSGIDVLLCVNSASEHLDTAKKFIAFMMEPENAQLYIDEQFAFSPIKGVEQKDAKVAGVMEDIAEGKVANFPDHYYPNGFDLASILSEFCMNYVNGMDDQENITSMLQECDEKYDASNIE